MDMVFLNRETDKLFSRF